MTWAWFFLPINFNLAVVLWWCDLQVDTFVFFFSFLYFWLKLLLDFELLFSTFIWTLRRCTRTRTACVTLGDIN